MSRTPSRSEHTHPPLRPLGLRGELEEAGLLVDEQSLGSNFAFKPSRPTFELPYGSRRLQATVADGGIEFRVIEMVRCTWRLGLVKTTDPGTLTPVGTEPVIRHVHWLLNDELAQLERDTIFGIRKGRIRASMGGRLVFLIFFRHYVTDFCDSSWVKVHLPDAWEVWKMQAEARCTLERMAEAQSENLPF